MKDCFVYIIHNIIIVADDYVDEFTRSNAKGSEIRLQLNNCNFPK